MTERPHDQHCQRCDMAEFSGITYEAAHAEAYSPNRCRCGVLVSVSHYCSALDHAWVSARKLARGCLYHREDPYPAGCADCADAVAAQAQRDSAGSDDRFDSSMTLRD